MIKGASQNPQINTNKIKYSDQVQNNYLYQIEDFVESSQNQQLINYPLEIDFTKIYNNLLYLTPKTPLFQNYKDVILQKKLIDVQQKRQANYQKLKDLIMHTIKESEKFKGKELVLLIGKTGAGKTTLIYALTGKRLMKRNKYQMLERQDRNEYAENLQEEELDDQDAVIISQIDVQGFKIGHLQSSQTKIPKSIDYDSIIYIDTAGRQDTNGLDYDISNSIGLSTIFSQGKSIKFVLVISQNTLKEGRGKQLRQRISQFIGFAPKIQLPELMASTTIVFTHIGKSKGSEKRIFHLLRQISQAEPQYMNNLQKVTLFINEMCKMGKEETKKGSKLNYIALATVQNIIKQQQGFLWHNKIKQSFKIKDTKGKFKVSLKEDEIGYLLKKVNAINRIITQLSNSYKFSQMKEYFQELKLLMVHTDEQQIKKTYNQLVFSINKLMKKILDDGKKHIDLLLSSQSQLSAQGILQISQFIAYLKEAEQLSQEQKQFEQKTILQDFLIYMKQRITMMMDYIKNKYQNLDSVYSTIEKLQKFCINFGQIIKIESIYHQFANGMSQKIRKDERQIVKMIQQGYYKGLSRKIQLIDDKKKIYSKFFGIQLANSLQDIKTLVIQSLKQRISKYIRPLIALIHDQTKQKCTKMYKNVKYLLLDKNFRSIIGQKSCLKLYQQTKSFINKQIESTHREINDKIAQKSYKDLQRPLLKLKLIRTIDGQILEQTNQKYYAIKNQLDTTLTKDIKQSIYELINFGEDGILNKQQVHKLKQKMNELLEMAQLKNIFENVRAQSIYNKVKDILNQKCKNISSNMKKSINDEVKQLQQQTNNKKRFEGVNKSMQFLQQLCQIDDRIKAHFDDAKQQIKTVILQYMNNMKQIMKDPSAIGTSSIDFYLIKLFHMKQINYGQGNIEEQLNKVKDLLQKQINFYIDRIQDFDLSKDQVVIIANIKNSTGIIKKINNLGQRIIKAIKFNQQIKQFVEKKIQNKFQSFYAEIKNLLKKKNTKQLKMKLQCLQKYKQSLSHMTYLKIKQKLQEFLNEYFKIIQSLPQRIVTALKKRSFVQLQQYLAILKRQDELQYTKSVDDIKNRINTLSQSILSKIHIIEDNADYLRSLKNSIQQLKQYQRLQTLIQTFGSTISEKNKRILQLLTEKYNQMTKDIQKSVEQNKFVDIKQKIQFVYKIKNILVNDIISQPIILKSMNQIQSLIKKEIPEEITQQNFYQSIKKVDKLSKFDRQNQSQLGKTLQNMLCKYMTMISEEILFQINRSTSIVCINTCGNSLKQLKNKNKAFSNQKSQNSNSILENIRYLQLQFDKKANSLIEKVIFNEEQMQNLSVLDASMYQKAREKLKTQWDVRQNTIQTLVQHQNVQKYLQHIQSLDKFIKVQKHIDDNRKVQSFKLTKNAVFEDKINQNFQKVNRMLKRKSDLSYKQIQTINQFMKYQIKTRGLFSTKILIQFNNLLRQYFLSKFPPINKSQSLDLSISHYDKLKKQPLIDSVKQYISQLQEHNIITNDKQPLFVLMDTIIPAKQFKNQIQFMIVRIQKQIDQLWKQSKCKQIYSRLIQIKNLGSKFNANEIYHSLCQKLKQQTQSSTQRLLAIMHKDDVQSIKQANINFKRIIAVENQLNIILGLSMIKKNAKSNITQIIFQQITEGLDDKIKNYILKNIVKQLLSSIVHLRLWVDKFPALQEKIDTKICQILVNTKEKNLIGPFVGQIDDFITTNKDVKKVTLVRYLQNRFREQLSIPIIMPKIVKDIQQTIKQFKCEGSQRQINRQELYKIYKIYQQQFNNKKQKYIAKGSISTIQNHKIQIKKNILSLKTKKTADIQMFKIHIPKVLANIFVYWSLSKSGKSFYEAQETGRYANQCLLHPHPVQVLSILRFVGCDTQQSILKAIKGVFINLDHLQNHIMQIKTGEGKSIILGVMAIILAMMGYQVDCVCYSAYLSDRDLNDLKVIFQELEVIKQISYGTFNQLSEKFINQKNNARNLTQNLFMPKKTYLKQNAIPKGLKKILLIDQVDTFFSRDFYGATYNPVTMLQNQEINKIIHKIWENKGLDIWQIIEDIKSTSQYEKISYQYSQCIKRIDNQFFKMIQDVKTYDSIPYVVEKDRIGYKQLDGISFNSVYGYKTMFAYMFEGQIQRGKISQETIKNNIGITLQCGQYSYAQIVKGYSKIFGVTGTLDCLSSFQEQILQTYKIFNKTFTPSVYGQSRRQELKILIQKTKDSHHQEIATKIDEIMMKKGAAMVFFQNQIDLMQFNLSTYVNKFKDIIKVVTQKTENKNYYIKKATQSGVVTLFTASYGRGTDFRVYDPLVEQNGVVVIQTFLSQELSQEIQIKGRTARQGKNGTYQMILNLQKINIKYKITQEMISKARQNEGAVYPLLHRKRLQYMEQVNNQRDKIVANAKIIHDQSIKMRKQLIKKTIPLDSPFFFIKKGQRFGQKARILFAIDGTGSMGRTIGQVKGKVMDMINSLSQKYPQEFQIQLMFYYGINAYDSQKHQKQPWNNNKIHRSEWTSNTQILKKFMGNVKAGGGSHHQAIELGLFHLILSHQQVGVNKCILIGDAGLKDNVNSSMQYHVHPQDIHRFKQSHKQQIVHKLHIGELLQKLKQIKIPIDSYPIGAQTHQTFQNISTKTNGKCKAFDPSKDNLSQQIGKTITQCIVMKR